VIPLKKSLQVLLQTTRIQLIFLSKSWIARLLDLLMPSAVAFVPILLGRTVAGEQAGFNFAQHTHTTNFAGFLLIGGGTYILVIRALWGFGNWLRQEMRGGTLESLYFTPASKAFILAGVALAFILYSASLFIGAMLIGALLFQIVFRTNQLLLAFVFLGVGLPPIYGLALFYGALVLRFKETDAFIKIAQWITTTLMGAYFPISLFPLSLRVVSLLFPPTWLTQGLRSALLGIPYFSHQWWIDLTILCFFCLAGPLLGYLIFTKTETTLRTNSGLGEF
jgi:ABC-2 type transport system permease protein